VSGGTPQRRLILYMAMSLDGFAAGRDGSMDSFGGRELHSRHRQRAVAELLGQTDMLVLGGHAAADMARAWPASESPTGQLMNSLPKIVFSSTLADLAWSNARISNRPAEEEIATLKSEPGKDIVVFGGAGFARSLAAHGVIDEYRINVHPVALGDGMPLLRGHDGPLPLELVASTAWADGVTTHTYVPR